MPRLAAASDLAHVQALAKAFVISFVLDEQKFSDAYMDLLSTPTACLAVDEVNGAVVGYLLGFSHNTFFANGPVGYVEELMVSSSHRRQGSGKRLMEFFEAWAKQHECVLSCLSTRRAAQFYQAIGYEASATYMRKSLR